MLATLSEPFDDDGWQYEIKWDGYRALAMMDKGEVNLLSRNNISFNKKYAVVYNALRDWKLHAVVDGEIVVLNENGKAVFGALQSWQHSNGGTLAYYVFDLLWLNGYNLTEVALEKRRELLQQLIPENQTVIRFSENFQSSASELLEAVHKMGMEGIIAKRSGSAYYPGTRSEDWLKMKPQNRHEVVIGGYTRKEGSPKAFSALLAGVFDQGKFRYTGKIGTGFSDELQKVLLRKFKPLIRKTNPFEILPEKEDLMHFRAKPRGVTVTFLQPKLVCEVSYSELTGERLMRHPSFAGLREDKSAESVGPEIALSPEVIQLNKAPKLKNMPVQYSAQETLLDPALESQTLEIDKKELKFTNLDKLYWPEDKISKRDLLNYYHQVADYILPYLDGRPMSLNRHPNGYKGPSFYQKDVTGKVPDWVETMPYHSEEEENIDKEFLVCKGEASLLLMANMGCIEMNPWNSRAKTPEHPDWCVVDLDPDKKNTFDQVIEVALTLYDLLKSADIESYCKTSGSTGLHLYIPLGAKYTYEQSTEFARIIVTLAQQRLPKITSIERAVSKRKGKIYLDFLQNRNQATLAAPYSVRPKPEAPVSMPLYWKEVKPGLKITDFTLHNVVPMLQERGDIFKGVLGKGIDMKAALERLELGLGV